MIENFKVLLFCFCLSICSSQVFAGENIVILKNGNYQELRETIIGYFEDRGYHKGHLIDEKNGFYAFVRHGDFGLPCEIILHYTKKKGTDKIFIDIGKASHDLITDSMVEDDIKEITDKIRNI